MSEADDAVQEAWLRLAAPARNMLRSRRSRREEPLGVHLPEPIVDRSPAAARQLASRARRRVQGENTVPGGFDALVAVLDPDVVRRADLGPTGGRKIVEMDILADPARLR